ncbi:hypothetical protein FRZ67_18490 [Panacibacter ginsenosidivorans]|uniref:DUF6436 domain-containing protein n=1 Tax=Panacibacter ginsenosidivorans TaxID=1813871 RepID=A0A5B8VDW7_9BACT|nr:hypothetical protein [Panacibacter ginsenosidivorans]QEC69203.1 hypothetical protein FRZ67_18490 [Panacibacter ginsenosidivorans]
MKKILFIIAGLLSSFMALQATPPGKLKIYLFLQSQCPCIYNHKETFGSLIKNYGDKVNFTAVFTDSKESNTAMQHLIHDLGWNLPYIKDNHHQLVQQLQPAVSTDCVLVDNRGNVLYKGAIDDGPMNMGTVKHFYLKDALEAYLHHLPIKISTAKGLGCFLQ